MIYIDDIVESFVNELSSIPGTALPDSVYAFKEISQSYKITLGDLAGRIQAFHEMQDTLMIPDLSERFTRCLYATYLSYLEPAAREYGLDIRADARGDLAEFIKSCHFGQVFVSKTHPGVTRRES